MARNAFADTETFGKRNCISVFGIPDGLIQYFPQPLKVLGVFFSDIVLLRRVVVEVVQGLDEPFVGTSRSIASLGLPYELPSPDSKPQPFAPVVLLDEMIAAGGSRLSEQSTEDIDAVAESVLRQRCTR